MKLFQHVLMLLTLVQFIKKSKQSQTANSVRSKFKYKLQNTNKTKVSNSNKQFLHLNDNNSIVGETYTTEDRGGIVIASTFSTAKTPNGNENYEDYITPASVNALMEEPPTPPKGPLEAVEETPSPGEYYDGSLNLYKVKVKCNIYTEYSQCIHQSGCGWCGQSNGCIFGTKFGPLQPCIQASYIGGVKQPSWVPTTKIVNERVGLVTATSISDIS